MKGFNNLAVSTALPVLSTSSSRVPQPANLHSFAPGPSHTHLEEQLLEDLAVSTALPVLSTGSSRVPQPADLHSFAPSPSHTHLEEQPLEDDKTIIPEVSQPPAVIEDKIQGQNSEGEGRGKGRGRGKGKEKAVNIDTGGVQDNLVIGTAGGRQKRRPKEYD